MVRLDYDFSRLIQTAACTGCRICADVCPAVSGSGQGRLSGLYRLTELRRLLRRRYGLLGRLLGRREMPAEKLSAYAETVFRCTLCGHCQAACPVGIELKELWFSLRQDLVRQGAYPEKADRIRENLKESHNVFAEDNEERAEWVEDLDEPPADGFIRAQAEMVYFTGCVASYYPLAQKIPGHLARIMTRAGVSFTLLGSHEWCCGYPLISAGQGELAQELIAHNIEAVRGRGARKVLFACPTCFQMWREHYPPEFELAHSSQWLAETLAKGLLPLKPLNLTVTYHDPCDLGRSAGVYEAPRQVLRLLPGVRFVELAKSRENCRCCGGGGSLEMFDPELTARIADQKVEEILATGAQVVATACQQCVRTITAAVRRRQSALRVMDLTELVFGALEN